MNTDIDDTVKRLMAQKNTTGVVIMDYSGRAIRSTLEEEATAQYCQAIHQLTDKSKGVVRDLDGTNDLTFLRLRTKKNEILVAPDKDYLMAVIQTLSANA
ncbi:unnamed protein product, partial [Mesorhabditis spiculigera]